jgi:hypothetical protein
VTTFSTVFGSLNLTNLLSKAANLCLPKAFAAAYGYEREVGCGLCDYCAVILAEDTVSVNVEVVSGEEGGKQVNNRDDDST